MTVRNAVVPRRELKTCDLLKIKDSRNAGDAAFDDSTHILHTRKLMQFLTSLRSWLPHDPFLRE
jgi:hypothetical protein